MDRQDGGATRSGNRQNSGGGGRREHVVLAVRTDDLKSQSVTTSEIQHEISHPAGLGIMPAGLVGENARAWAGEDRVATLKGRVELDAVGEVGLHLIAHGERANLGGSLWLGVPVCLVSHVAAIAFELPDGKFLVGISVALVVDEVQSALLATVAGRHVEDGECALLDELALSLQELNSEKRLPTRYVGLARRHDRAAVRSQESVSRRHDGRANIKLGRFMAGRRDVEAGNEFLDNLGLREASETGGSESKSVLHCGGNRLAVVKQENKENCRRRVVWRRQKKRR